MPPRGRFAAAAASGCGSPVRSAAAGMCRASDTAAPVGSIWRSSWRSGNLVASGQLQEAAEYRQRHDFDAALSRLKAVAAVEDPRLQACVQQASELLQELAAERERWQQTAEEARGQAEQHLAAYRYEEAVAVLERVPEPLRPAQVVDLLAEACAKRDEVAGLTAAIRDAVRASELQDLPSRINRLLELQPGHETAKRLARQLRDRLVATAKKKLAADEFGAALRILDQIPESEQDEEVEAVRDRSRELEWLLQDIKLIARRGWTAGGPRRTPGQTASRSCGSGGTVEKDARPLPGIARRPAARRAGLGGPAASEVRLPGARTGRFAENPPFPGD